MLIGWLELAGVRQSRVRDGSGLGLIESKFSKSIKRVFVIWEGF